MDPTVISQITQRTVFHAAPAGVEKRPNIDPRDTGDEHHRRFSQNQREEFLITHAHKNAV